MQSKTVNFIGITRGPAQVLLYMPTFSHMNLITVYRLLILLIFCLGCQQAPEQPEITTAKWQKVTLDFNGPTTSEMADPNPFTTYRLEATLRNGDRSLTLPGFYAADGRAAQTGADSGNVWQVRFRPDAEGTWTYEAKLYAGEAIEQAYSGIIEVGPPTAGETGRLVRNHPRYLQWTETSDYFLKGGADSPENLLAYRDFDGTYRHSEEFREGESATEGLHHYTAHEADFQAGDPSWMGEKGKGLIGGINYLASKGVNSIYFLTMNINGDGKDVWPYTSHEVRDRFDVSKLDQWEIVFDHADSLGMMLHFVLNETENETLLDGGDTGPERQLYFRELVARFGHHRAVTWNLGEENGPNNWSETAQTNAQQAAVCAWFEDNDPYDNYVVLHTHPGADAFAKIYEPLLGNSDLDGLALQLGDFTKGNEITQKWLGLSAEAGAPWIMTIDETGPWWQGLDPDDWPDNNQDSLRALVLWGNLMAGGAGVEWYFGAQRPHNDLNMEDWRSRDRAWEWTTTGLEFFRQHIPFHEMEARNELVSEGTYCFAKAGEVYAVYLPFGGQTELNLGGAAGEYDLAWYNPRTGGALVADATVTGGERISLTGPGPGDWAAVIRAKAKK